MVAKIYMSTIQTHLELIKNIFMSSIFLAFNYEQSWLPYKYILLRVLVCRLKRKTALLALLQD